MKLISTLSIIGLCMSSVTFAQNKLNVQVNSSSDDAEQKFDGSKITTTSSDLELVYDDWNNQQLQTVGIRFAGVNIPADAVITKAYIQFTAKESTSGNISLKIVGEKSQNAATFTDDTKPGNLISDRPTTSSSVIWSNIPDWNDKDSGNAQRTPDLKAIVSEIINNNGWKSGNALAFIITGDGSDGQLRKAYSYDGKASRAPKLFIEYKVNTTPTIDPLYFSAGSQWKTD